MAEDVPDRIRERCGTVPPPPSVYQPGRTAFGYERPVWSKVRGEEDPCGVEDADRCRRCEDPPPEFHASGDGDGS